MGFVTDEVKYDVNVIAGDLVRLDTYELSLGDEWRGCVTMDAATARRLATALAVAATEAERIERLSPRRKR